MLAFKESPTPMSSAPQPEVPNLRLESTIEELSLYNFQVEIYCLGKEVTNRFEVNPLLPGVILTEYGKFVGMISRRRFLEQMSRPYGLELFLKRPLYSLYSFVSADILKLRGNTQIVEAANRSLERSAKLLYEPIVVEIEPEVYRLLDVHQLLLAQSQIHKLTYQLLDKQIQVQMIQTEKMVSLGKMVASVAHEIKNPVTAITCNLGFLHSYCQQIMEILSVYELDNHHQSEVITELKQQSDLDFIREDLPKVLKSMKLGSERLTKIVSGLHNFSHMGELNRAKADIHECIENILLILNNRLKYGIKVINNYGELPLVNCYLGQLSQVFMNIISNGIDALTEKAEQQVAEAITWQAQIEISTEVLQQSDSEWICIRIADNGPGIPPAIREHIFEPFFTTKPIGKGSGLGLAISHQIVTAKHGGKLLVHSRESHGTEFQILLPIF
ncbi:MAG: ATP-binding protein [Symploca sp. SIO2B6]|nr:ATP-binding protein [Symploca sp. SIO2B6]